MKLWNKVLRLLDISFIAIPILVGIFSIGLVILLLLDQFRDLYIFGLVLPLSIAIWLLFLRKVFVTREKLTLERNIANIFILSLILIWTGYNSFFNAQHIVTNRDPATYTVASKWLIDNPSVKIPMVTDYEGEVTGVVSSSAGFAASRIHKGEINAQGLHVLPALIASAGKIVGTSVSLKFNVVIGATALMAVFAVAKLVARPFWSALSVTALSLSMPFLYFSRDIYTEPLTTTVGFAGLFMLAYLAKNIDKLKNIGFVWLISGAVLGVAGLVRADGILFGIAPIIFFGFLMLTSYSKKISELFKSMIWYFIGLFGVYVLAWLDLSQLSSHYYHDIRYLIEQQAMILSGIAFVFIVLIWLQSKRDFYSNLIDNHFKALKFAVISIPTAAMTFLLSRPLWQENYSVKRVRIDGDLVRVGSLGRSFPEYAAFWPIIYLSPMLAISALVGWIAAVLAALKDKKNSAFMLPLAITVLLISLAYFYKPGISSDQIWASRRHLTVAMPGLTIFGAIGLGFMYDRFKSRLSDVSKSVAIVFISLAIIGWPLIVSRPLIAVRDTARLGSLTEVCSVLPDNSVVMYLKIAGRQLTMGTRAYCGNKAVSESTKSTESLQSTLRDFKNHALSKGEVPFVAYYEYELHKFDELVPNNDSLRAVNFDFTELEQSYRKPPTSVINQEVDVRIGTISDDGLILGLGGQ